MIAHDGEVEASDTEHFIPGKKIDIQLGYGGTNADLQTSIVKVQEKFCVVDGVPFSFRGGGEGPPPPNGLFDRAFMQVQVLVFERPDAA